MPQLTRETIELLSPTGPTDPIVYYRRPIVGRLFLERVNMGLRMLSGRRFNRLLEIGYGAGAVLLAMSSVADEVHGLDLDADPSGVSAFLRQRGCSATLAKGDVRSLPYENDFFDLVISFSVFEHIGNYREALREVGRVLRPGGIFLLGMPAVHKAMALAFRAIGFKGIDHHHVTAPRDVSAVFSECGFHIDDIRQMGLRVAPLYTTWRLSKVA
jgi:cyclopropane fatty-acyl-phospholipid synthase-like methyltransferase